MLKSLWLALLAVGLWASLVPQVEYVSSSSDAPSDQILVAWPGWGVQQDLGQIAGVVGTFHVWVSAEPGGDRTTVWASLVDASTQAVLRQTSINAAPDAVTVRQKLDFPSYVVPDGQRLLLQLQVADFEKNYVIYKLATENPGIMNVAVNGIPNVGDGPLAFSHTITGSGLRTAILGDSSARIRLILAGAVTVLAILAHLRIGSRLQPAGSWVRLKFRLLQVRIESFGRYGARQSDEQTESGIDRVLNTPWYPWPTASMPILHFLSSNTLHFAVVDAVVPLALVLVCVTASMASLRLTLRNSHRSALITVVLLVVFFGYGHVARTIDDRVDERIFFAFSVVFAAALIVVIVRAAGSAQRLTQLLNLASVVLLMLPVVSLVGNTRDSLLRSQPSEAVADELVERLLPDGIADLNRPRPDIYYIILDEYTRSDALGEFDNSEFIDELEWRGFYVASQATSNYDRSIESIPSSLNMSYLDTLGKQSPETDADLIGLARANALSAILKRLGYTYVHLESGHAVTDDAPLADHLVVFRRSGTEMLVDGIDVGSLDFEIFSRKFSCELARTTLLWPALKRCVLTVDDETFDWWSPMRALRMFDFLSSPIGVQRPMFVFAHIVKPHPPATFDRYGNYVSGNSVYDEFDDRHDPSVPSAYIGQLIYINRLVLSMVDNIIEHSESDPIIVLAGDHGKHHDRFSGHLILAAFHLPSGGNVAVYPSISSVNHFRAVLSYYFDLDLGLIEDRVG